MRSLRSPFGDTFGKDDAANLAAVIKVLADRTRLRIIHLLHTHGEMTVVEMTPLLGLSQPAVSHHVQVLQTARLIRQVPGINATFKPRRLDLGELSRLVDALLVGGDR